MVDHTTGWLEFARAKNQASKFVTELFHTDWLCRFLLYDKTGDKFQKRLHDYKIVPKPATEREKRQRKKSHLLMADMERTKLFEGAN